MRENKIGVESALPSAEDPSRTAARPAERSDQLVLWPYDARTALLLTPVLLIVLVLAIALLHAISDWPGSGSDNLLLGGILVLGLLPLGLLLVDIVASRGGSVGFRGLQIEFSATGPDRAPVTLSVNLGNVLPGTIVTDSGRASVLSALQATAASRVAVVDLSEAGGWWPTRLFALCAGAAHQGGPDTIAFVSGRDRHNFVGYASSAALRDAFLATRDDYRAAHKQAVRISSKLSLVPPTDVGEPPPVMPATDPELTGAQIQDLVREAFPVESDQIDSHVFERALLKYLAPLETPPPPPESITADELHRQFASVVFRDRVDRSLSPHAQVEELLRAEGPWVAVTEDQAFRGLRERMSLLQDVLHEVINALERPRRG
jgi:hypothetical protein